MSDSQKLGHWVVVAISLPPGQRPYKSDQQSTPIVLGIHCFGHSRAGYPGRRFACRTGSHALSALCQPCRVAGTHARLSHQDDVIASQNLADAGHARTPGEGAPSAPIASSGRTSVLSAFAAEKERIGLTFHANLLVEAGRIGN